ncbi:hypothetical protein BD779DRAFT_1678681 [Infundibulicybe gibba]|nr:hypothetical protein BD779DRAFT_1678681 [Infundibulicybe gibba]
MDTNISDARDIRLHGYLVAFAVAFFYYDHLITVDREIKYLWTRPKKPSTYLFLVNRYFLFSVNMVEVYFGFTESNPTAQRFGFPSKLRELQLVTPDSHCGKSTLFLMTLRVYALYRCSSRLLGGMVTVAIVLFILACGTLFSQGGTAAQPVFGCHVGLSYDSSARIVTAWESLFAYDSMIFTLTLIKTWQARRSMKLRTRELSIITLLLRDGAVYFAVMTLSNLANILTFYFCGPFLRGGLSTFSTSISVTMMSRLMLNLHETASIGIFSTYISTGDRRVSRFDFLDSPAGLEFP